MSQARILVVDDERFFRETIREVLEPRGFDLVFASDGTSALEEGSDETLGVVILDLQLPDLHGLEVFRRLREMRPELRVIILSAHTDQEYVLEALRLGACDYLAKPIHEEELLLAVRRAMETFDLAASRERLRQRLQRLDRALEALRRRASGAVDSEGLRMEAVHTVAELVGAGRSSLLLLDEKTDKLRVAAAQGGKIPAEQMDPVPVGDAIAGLVQEQGEALLVADLATDPRVGGRVHPERYATASFAVAPVAVGERVLGVLCASDPERAQSFDEDDLTLLRIFAGELAPLLEAPASGDRGPDESAPGEIGTALAKAICEAVTAEVEPARILDAVLRPISELLNAAPVALHLTAPSGDALLREAECDGARASDRVRIAVSRGLTGTVLETGRLVATGDPSLDPRFDPEVDTAEDGIVRPFLCGPLRFRDKILGVFRVFPDRPGFASPEFGEVLTAALSAAVRNVLLYRSLVETIEEVAAARRQGEAAPSGSRREGS